MALGASAALRKDGWFDHIASAVALAITSLPEFVVGIALIILLSTTVTHLLPAVSLLPPGTYFWNQPKLLVLPIATLVLVIAPYIFRMMRAAMVEALESDYVEMARLKGIPSWKIVVEHALPNAIAPTIQVVGLSFLYLAGGIVIVENVFAYPGIGQGLYYAVQNRDIPVDPAHRRDTGGVLRLYEHRHRRHRPPCQPPPADSALTMTVAAPAVPPVTKSAPTRLRRRQWLTVLGEAVRTPRGAVGLALTGFVVLVAVIGPFVAPHSPTAFVAPDFSKPSSQLLLGTDTLGRDVVSRVLDGGWVLLIMALAATVFGIVVGAIAGVSAAYLRGRWDGLIMRTVDIVLAFPQLVFALLLVSILGPKLWLIVLAVGFLPRTRRGQGPPLRHARDLRAGLRQGRGAAGNEAVAGDGQGDHPQPHLADHGRGGPPAHLLDRDNGRAVLPRLRPASAGGELGLMVGENQTGLVAKPVGCRRAGRAHRPPHDWHQHLHRCRGAGGDRRRPPAGGGSASRRHRSTGGMSDERGAPIGVMEPAEPPAGSPVRLEVRDLEIRLANGGADVVSDVSFSVPAGHVLGLVGESGSGKTTVALALLGHAGRGLELSHGAVLLDGTDLLSLGKHELQELRGGLSPTCPRIRRRRSTRRSASARS